MILAGTVAVSSAAYGIGTQVGGGSAAAGSDGANGNGLRDWQRGPAGGFGNLAGELGVEPAELRAALRDFHERKRGDRPERAAQALADALGIPAERVEAGLDALRDRHQTRFASRLAAELGTSADRVEAALDRLGDDRPHDPQAFVQELADQLGLPAEEVHRALWSARPSRDGHPPRLPLRALAEALDVSRSDLRKAFRELHTHAREGREKAHDELARFLADRFGLSVERVEEALPEPPAHGRGPGPHGPPGFGP